MQFQFSSKSDLSMPQDILASAVLADGGTYDARFGYVFPKVLIRGRRFGADLCTGNLQSESSEKATEFCRCRLPPSRP